VLADMSPMKMRVGSDLQPAPIEEITGRLFLWQYSSRATLLSMLSMASTMKSGFRPSQGASKVLAATGLKSSFLRSKCTHGVICCNLFFKQDTFGVPTSARVATACRLREESVTWSKSMRRMYETPERARAAVQCDPTPPAPITIMNAERSFCNPASVRKTRFRASCSRMSSAAS
jgi:hypothetical protein